MFVPLKLKNKLWPRLVITLAALFVYLVTGLDCLAQGISHGSNFTPMQDQKKDAKYYGEQNSGGLVLKGEITYKVPKGTPVKLKLATVPSTGLHLMDRTLDGDLLPAQLNQKLSARVTEDLYVDNSRVIPEGTIFYGHVSRINPPRRMYRPGSVQIEFTKLKLPDGRVFAFKIEADSTKASTKKTKAKGFGRLMAYGGGGAVVGAIAAYQISGWQATASMHGYNIAAGAALGAVSAITYAALKKGKVAVLEPGDDLNMSIDADLLMPVAQKPGPKKKLKQVEDLQVEILKTKIIDDGLDRRLLKTELTIDNQTSRTFRSIDIYLEDTNGNRNPLSSGGDFDSDLMFDVQPYSFDRYKVHFSMEWPKLKHRIVILDHATRKPVHFTEWM